MKRQISNLSELIRKQMTAQDRIERLFKIRLYCNSYYMMCLRNVSISLRIAQSGSLKPGQHSSSVLSSYL